MHLAEDGIVMGAVDGLVLGVHLQDSQAVGVGGAPHVNHAVKAPRPQQRVVQQARPGTSHTQVALLLKRPPMQRVHVPAPLRN